MPTDARRLSGVHRAVKVPPIAVLCFWSSCNCMKTELRGVFLDFDGTIAHTERGHRAAYNRAFAELHLDWHWSDELYTDLLRVAGGKERLHYYLSRYRPELLDQAIEQGLIDKLHRFKTRNFAVIAPTIPFRSGIQRLVYEAYFAGWQIAIVTTASKSGVEALLTQDSAFRPMIDVIASGEVVERKKPAPDIYEFALEQLNLRPDECVAVEDSHIGLCSALAAGIATIVTASPYTARDDFSGAAAVLSDLGDYDRKARSISGPFPPKGIVDLDFLRDVRALRNGAATQS